MTPKEAAEIIGCDVSGVRRLIRSGELKAKRRKLRGYVYDIDPEDVLAIRDRPRLDQRGRPRKRPQSETLEKHFWYPGMPIGD